MLQTITDHSFYHMIINSKQELMGINFIQTTHVVVIQCSLFSQQSQDLSHLKVQRFLGAIASNISISREICPFPASITSFSSFHQPIYDVIILMKENFFWSNAGVYLWFRSLNAASKWHSIRRLICNSPFPLNWIYHKKVYVLTSPAYLTYSFR